MENKNPLNTRRISFQVENSVARIGFGYGCQKSMTVLDLETLTELKTIVEELESQGKKLKGAIFFTHKERCFLAGADIKLIASLKEESEGVKGSEEGQTLFNRIEDLPFPTVACVHGICLGGGTELVLSCEKIFASDDGSTQMGLPEVKLGLIPGFGGTWRLPQRVALPQALDLILSGRSVRSSKAKRMGLVDEVYKREHLEGMAEKSLVGLLKLRGARRGVRNWREGVKDFALHSSLGRKVIFQKARESVLKKTKGFYQAPLKILDVMESAQGKARRDYLNGEAQAFGELCVSEQSKNLQHIYFIHERAKKYPRPSTGKAGELKRGACLGAGAMGGGITWLMANEDMFPIMKDISEEAIVLGLKQVNSNFQERVKRRRMSLAEWERKMRSISTRQDHDGFLKVDLLVEAVVENLDIKKKVLAEAEREMREDAIITSNTSSLLLDQMVGALKKPERFAGLHFFNPVHRMPLVEIVTHSHTSDETVESLYRWVLKTKKIPVIVKDGPGFLVNRILTHYLNEAAFLLEEGIPIKDIDGGGRSFGMPMGPLRLMDELGLELGNKVAKIILEGLGERMVFSQLISRVCKEGQLKGKKSGVGFYFYDKRGKECGANEAGLSFLSLKRQKSEEREIQKRLFLPMINEAALILEEQLVDDPRDVDLSLIFGIGFPPFRGGLLKYADALGLPQVVESLEAFAGEFNRPYYRPCAYLKRLAEEKKGFYHLEG